MESKIAETGFSDGVRKHRNSTLMIRSCLDADNVLDSIRPHGSLGDRLCHHDFHAAHASARPWLCALASLQPHHWLAKACAACVADLTCPCAAQTSQRLSSPSLPSRTMPWWAPCMLLPDNHHAVSTGKVLARQALQPARAEVAHGLHPAGGVLTGDMARLFSQASHGGSALTANPYNDVRDIYYVSAPRSSRMAGNPCYPCQAVHVNRPGVQPP